LFLHIVIGMTVKDGETEKNEYYTKHFRFPEGVKVVPFVIDAYGKWGESAKSWVDSSCKRAAGNDTKLYNTLVSRARETISLAHARGVGIVLDRCIQRCIDPDDYAVACARGGGA